MSRFLDKLFPVETLFETARRFSLSVICALGLFIIAITSIHDLMDLDDELMGRICVLLGTCYFWFGIGRIVSESQGLSLFKSAGVYTLGAIGLAALTFIPSLWALHIAFITPALLLIVMFCAYLKGGDDYSFWCFNRITWLGVFISYIALILFAGGLSIALWAIDILFGIDVESDLFMDIWAFACLVLGPIYALSWVPKTFEFTQEEKRVPSGLTFIVNWISAPMVFVYLLILYAYFIKIIVTGTMPDGHLAYMISGFAGAGIVTYLVAWPFRENGTPQLRLFYKIFFPALLVPVGFHFFAIWERVSAYGVTEQRYMLIVSAVWFAMLVITNSFQKIPIKAIPATLAILMIFASFGPWSAVSVSGMSQYSRLESLLKKNDALKQGKVVEAPAEISFHDRKNISSILQYLCRTERDDMLQPWFVSEKQGKEDSNFKCYARELTKKIGFEYVYRYSHGYEDGRFRLYRTYKNHFDVSGYTQLVQNISFYLNKAQEGEQTRSVEIRKDVSVKAVYDAGRLRVYEQEQLIADVDVQAFVHDQYQADDNEKRHDLIIEGQNDNAAYRVMFDHINGEVESNTPVIQNFSFDILYRKVP